ncbi:unnamed protein product [Lymnaea stagnalis]|uniref:Protein kinase domain-containing protein n=1 Tax=Lymnaea stagnalis TaxID=6523 RepID=A0AAV2HR21_LYMST
MPLLKRRDFWIDQSTKRYTFSNQYEIKNELGRGPNSIVYECQRRGLQMIYAVKLLRKNINKKVCLADAGILLKLDHRNLVRLQEIFETRNRIYIVQELVSGGELFERIVQPGSNYSEQVASRAIRDVVNGLKYLHFFGYAVKNLKPENLVYEDHSDDAHVKIADFAMSSIVSPELEIAATCRFPGYTAPEIMKGFRADRASDMWSLGVIIFILLFGYEPFSHEDPVALFKKIIKGQFEFPAHDTHEVDEVSVIGKDLVRKLLQVDPKDRLTAEKAYRNSWVNSVAVKSKPLEFVVAKIRDLNATRKQKALLPPLSVSTIHSQVSQGYLFLVKPRSATQEAETTETAIQHSKETSFTDVQDGTKSYEQSEAGYDLDEIPSPSIEAA